MKERNSRRSSGILKRVLPEDLEINDDQTEDTKFFNPSQKRFSKRVSFADSNQIKEIARVQDIKQDWHDSTSSSEEGSSCLADIGNLTTPTIRKLQQKQSGGDSKALQNLLKSTIIDGGMNKSLNQTQGSCAMDISAAVSTAGLSFFDNSKLEFGGTEGDDGNAPLGMRNPDEKENVDLTLSLYTKDFLRSLELGSKSNEDKSSQNNLADEDRYPHINPPSYKECVESAGLKSIHVSTMKSEDSCVNTDNGDNLDFTCAIQSVSFNQENSSEISQEKISTSGDGDMEFTCVLQPHKMVAQAESEGALNHSTASDDGGDDMGLTCVILQQGSTCKSEAHSGLSTNEIDTPIRNNEEMDFTECLTSYMDKQMNKEAKVTVESCSAGGDTDDEIDFTCMVPLGKAALSHQITLYSGNTEQIWDKNAMINEEMDFTEVVKIRGKESSSVEKICVDECTNDDDVDLTCSSFRTCAEEVESGEPCQMTDAKIRVNLIPVSRNEDVMVEANYDVVQNVRSTHDESVMDFTCVITPDGSTQATEPYRNTITDIHSTALFSPLEVSEKTRSTAQQNKVQTVQQGEPEIFVLDTQSENNFGSGGSDADKSITIGKENATELHSDSEDITFASPLKKRLHKIRNSIGLYKSTIKKQALRKRAMDSMLESKNKSEPSSSADECPTEEDGIVCAKRPKSAPESDVAVPESQEANLMHFDHSKLSISMDVPAQGGVFLPDTQDDLKTATNLEDIFEIPETQNAKPQSPVNHYSVYPAQSDEDIMCGSARDEHSVEDCASTTDVAVIPSSIEKCAPSNETTTIAEESSGSRELQHSLHEEQTKALGLSIALDKSLEDIRRMHCGRKENITVQEFLCDFAEINIGNFKKSRHSTIVPSVKPQAPTSLVAVFEANYWVPREVSTRESCVELMRNKIEWLEKSVSDLEEQLNTSNPEIFKTVQSNTEENTDILFQLKQLARSCKTLGNVYWKRDAMKIFKGLKKEMNTYIDETLLPVTQQLDPSKELLDKALGEIEQENERLDKSLQDLGSEKSPPSSDQAALYQGLQTELDVLSASHEELLSIKSSAEIQKCEVKKRQKELLNKIIDEDFMISKPRREKRQLQESLATLQKSSEWKLQKVADDSLIFSFLDDSITFTASFEENLASWEWNKKIKSYSLETDAAAEGIMPFDTKFFALIHVLWKSALVLPNLVMEYSNLSGLKNVLEVLSNLSRASKQLINDKDWVNCQLVCEARACSQDSLITVSFLPPQPGIDGFDVKFTFDCDASETSGSKLNCILQNCFVPTSSEYVPGNRLLDHLGKGDVKRVLESVEPGRHYLRRAVDGLLKKIDYKF